MDADDVLDDSRRRHFENTLLRLLELGALPIINENDTVATEELGIGDNDTLGAIVAVAAKADLLVLLTDIDGLYTADPHKDPHAQRRSWPWGAAKAAAWAQAAWPPS